MSSGGSFAPGGTLGQSGATTTATVNVACAVLHQVSSNPGHSATAYAKIQSCTINGVPAAWTGTGVHVSLQVWDRNHDEYLELAADTGYSSAEASSNCGAGTSWRNVSTASALVSGYPVSGGPWYNYTTC